MIWLRVLLTLQVTFLVNSISSTRAFAADPADELQLDDEGDTKSSSSQEKVDENVSFDDFEKSNGAAKPAEDEANPEEMTLEPLNGDENQVAEPPAPEPEPQPQMAEPTPTTTDAPPTETAMAQPVADDQPDLAYEAKLYDIYINFHAQEMPADKWQMLIGARESEVYTIQPGDTLWSISQTLFNDGNYWPKIWALNRSIANPHLIRAGNSIHFLLGNESEAPAFAVTEEAEAPVEQPMAEAEPPPAEAGAAGAPGAAVAENVEPDKTPQDEVEIPGPSEEIPPVLKHVPPSLPEYNQKRLSSLYDASGISVERRKIMDLRETKFLESFVDDDGIVGEGEIREIEGGSMAAAIGQYVFIAFPPGRAKTGDVYFATRALGKIKREVEDVATHDLGFQYAVLGELKVEELLSTTTGEEPRDIFRAVVTKAITQIDRGARVMVGHMPEIQVTGGEPSNLQTQIVAGDYAHGQRILGLYGLAFLPVGSEAGIKMNQILTVRANTRMRAPDSPVKESYLPIGKIKIVRVAKQYSTAMVTQLWDAIRIGDVTGEGKVVPPDASPEGQKRQSKRAAAPEVDSSAEENFDSPDSSAPAEAPAGDDLNLDDEDL